MVSILLTITTLDVHTPEQPTLRRWETRPVWTDGHKPQALSSCARTASAAKALPESSWLQGRGEESQATLNSCLELKLVQQQFNSWQAEMSKSGGAGAGRTDCSLQLGTKGFKPTFQSTLLATENLLLPQTY